MSEENQKVTCLYLRVVANPGPPLKITARGFDSAARSAGRKE